MITQALSYRPVDQATFSPTRDVGTEVENRKMITQALSYRPVDQATFSPTRMGKARLRPVDFTL